MIKSNYLRIGRVLSGQAGTTAGGGLSVPPLPVAMAVVLTIGAYRSAAAMFDMVRPKWSLNNLFV
jgi:hypothetical protein